MISGNAMNLSGNTNVVAPVSSQPGKGAANQLTLNGISNIKNLENKQNYADQAIIAQIVSFKDIGSPESGAKSQIRYKISVSDGHCFIKGVMTNQSFEKLVSVSGRTEPNLFRI